MEIFIFTSRYVGVRDKWKIHLGGIVRTRQTGGRARRVRASLRSPRDDANSRCANPCRSRPPDTEGRRYRPRGIRRATTATATEIRPAWRELIRGMSCCWRGNAISLHSHRRLDTAEQFISHLLHDTLQPFNGLFSRTTWVSRYRKGKTNLDCTGARDSEWQWHQLGRMQVCTSLQTEHHASNPPLCFLQAGCPSCRPTNSVKALKASHLLQIFRNPPCMLILLHT